ncbi:purine-nucleoside phosphorylase [Neolewinella lacunae]|uniref:Purine nucleoside phosphorylase n=1 Tax=Neolewinella lacunae TaxID=1517758 RepID=A0A923T7R6_9BACT|nr:purine-nucleoside phosphorylase [Neolewinella lacunae]MBC6994810.1 purine-nucleoside phosphorylase [Neolewinella lacunae]MDN3634432.1 purine-nucleoside phosphorylase [Neolewinella lacunae]
MTLYDQIQECLAFIRQRSTTQPRLGIILGTGLSSLADDIVVEREFVYGLLPYFAAATVESHRGKLILGTLHGVPVVAMAGRLHYYEGYSMQQLTFPVRVLAALGIEQLIISNASGSVNSGMDAGDIIFVRDHINLQPENPLRGHNDERLGPRFPDMLSAYDRRLNAWAIEQLARHGLKGHEGVYLALPGPNLETPAEYRMANLLGADCIGMSTVPEVLVARHAGLPVFVISVVSNKCFPITEIQPTTVDDVIETVQAVEPKLRTFMRDLLEHLAGAK